MTRTFLDGREIDREWVLVGTLVAVLVAAVGLSVLVRRIDVPDRS